jgi:hypothetical protein
VAAVSFTPDEDDKFVRNHKLLRLPSGTTSLLLQTRAISTRLLIDPAKLIGISSCGSYGYRAEIGCFTHGFTSVIIPASFLG